MLELSQYRDLYISEAQERLQAITRELILLEQNPAEEDAFPAMLRAVHTLKGMAGTMHDQPAVRLAHSLEDLLLRLKRAGYCPPDALELLYHTVDVLENLVTTVLSAEPRDDAVSDLVLQLEKLEIEPLPERPPAAARSRTVPSPVFSTVRIHVQQLDRLLNLVGQLLTSHHRLQAVLPRAQGPDLEEASAEHSRLLLELHEAVLRARMLPVEYLLSRYTRMVRDLAEEQSKEIDLIVEGVDIELDRSLLEALHEPLLHLLRNAVAHGIELPEERTAAGKARRGQIRIAARRDREWVCVDVSDDGRGLNPARIRVRAQAEGFITPAQSEQMSDAETLNLLGRAGLSLASRLDDVSGRGIGLNAVRAQVDALRGTLTLESTPGVGTTFRLCLPTRLATLQALVVRTGPELYAIPLSLVRRTVPVPASALEGQEVWLEEHIPGRRLADLVQLPAELQRPADPSYALILQRDAGPSFCLVADQVLGTQEILLKPLALPLTRVRGLGGASILEDGQIALVLDFPALGIDL